MTDVAPARGRSSGRGRGGYGSRGGRAGSRQTNGAPRIDDEPEDQGEIGALKKQYSSELSTLKELFPDWTDVDLVLALQETNGDLPNTIERITEGHVSKFEDAPKAKDRSRSKAAKEHTGASSDPSNTTTRGGRGRGGFEGTRGGRGRGGERGRGPSRGGRGGAQAGANGTRGATGATSVPTKEADGWNVNEGTGATAATGNWDTTTAPTDESQPKPEGQYGSVVTSSATPATASEGGKPSLLPEKTEAKPAQGGWASLFRKKPEPKPAPAPPKPAAVPPPAEHVHEEPAAPEPVAETEPEQEVLPTPPADPLPEIPPIHEPAAEEAPADLPTITTTEDGTIHIPPSKDQLTEDNVEHLPDMSHPAPTETAASTVASTVATPITQHPPIGRPGLGGFATSALKATTPGGRSASFQRKILEQQEAVVMPGNHAVDRVGVQFGSMGLNGDAEPDVDDEREEAETRAQLPQDSPVQQPRTSLPPAPRQSAEDATSPEALPTPKQSQGLPPAPQQQAQPSPPGLSAQATQQQPAPANQGYNQFGLRGNQNIPSDIGAPPQKPYDPFTSQISQPGHFEGGYPSHSQASAQPPVSAQSQLGGFSSAPDAYSSYYTSDYNRNAYQQQYSGYNQQASAQQQAGEAQQRTGSAFGAAPGGESGYPSNQAAQQAQSRYGEAQNSGANTPNPPFGGAQHQSGAQQSQHPQQSQQLHGQGQGQHGQFPGYGGHPGAYYNSYGYQNYMNQYGPYGGQGFGGGYGGKGGMYGQHPGYGMSPQSSYDQHSSSPAANVSQFGGRANDAGFGGLGDYGRSGSTQPSQSQQQQHASSGGFGGGFPESFGRNQSGYPGGNQYGQQQGAQQSGMDDSLKPFGESKAAAGASPSSLGQQGRPGSATNTTGAQQNALPPPQSQQHGFPGGYGSQFGGQYGGLGGLGGQQNQHQGGYGGFGGYGNSYGSYGQQRGGWGGNYSGGH